MATIALSLAGQFVGGAVAGPFGATIGRALGAVAGNALDQTLFAEEPAQKTHPDLRFSGSSEGGSIKRAYGWNRVDGNIIWATQLKRTQTDQAGSKGASQTQSDVILSSFALALCEGEISHIGRIWADNRLLENEDLNLTIYRGTEDQQPNALIQSFQGADATPAYKGLCYLVFEDLPLSQFGNRIPNLSVEICRTVGEVEENIKAITLIPGATEFGYDPEPRVRILSGSASAPENTHHASQTSDWDVSISQLLDLCPNLKHVALVVTWFGTDLRCAQCLVEPRVDNAAKQMAETSWRVSGLDRAAANVVSQHEGGAAFGGTPSDSALLAAIADLKARGINVTLYPFLMMDIEQSNTLANPYTLETGQPAYPWRGRITCDPAPDASGSPDQTALARSQVEAFVGSASASDFEISNGSVNFTGSAQWSYRRMVLHYAKLCELAGGVDAFLIGSELRGLTQIRDTANTFPFVDELRYLAAEARSILGAGTKITYAADWSEYHGYQPVSAPGDKHFHLDPLWADSNIDAIGIDNYFPLTDWRGEGEGLDAELSASIYDLDYLQSRIAAGENFDWYYANEADRQSQTRSAISDLEHGEPWIWRSKDLVSWWSNAHHDRINSVRQPKATAWIAQSKPIWFTELGCGAVDKGTNQPNLFSDPKSSENAQPYFSNGAPDTLLQRQFIRAQQTYWDPLSAKFEASNNPISSAYADHMLDFDRLYFWTWDARPFPAFPLRDDVWSDGSNYTTGHWLNGRLGCFAADELAQKISSEFDLEVETTGSGQCMFSGLALENPHSARSALAELVKLSELNWRQDQGVLQLVPTRSAEQTDLLSDRFAAHNSPLLERTRPDAHEIPEHLVFDYQGYLSAYQSQSVSARTHQSGNVIKHRSSYVFDQQNAAIASASLLSLQREGDQIQFDLPLSQVALQPGDQISIDGDETQIFAIQSVQTDDVHKITALEISGRFPILTSQSEKSFIDATNAAIAYPSLVLAHVSSGPNDPRKSQLEIAVASDPWPGTINMSMHGGETQVAELNSNAKIGEIVSFHNTPNDHGWDHASFFQVQLAENRHIVSLPFDDVLSGANQALLEHEDGTWERFAYSNAILQPDGTYIVTGLLRGLLGTERHMASEVVAPGRILFVDASVQSWAVPTEATGTSIDFGLSGSSLPIGNDAQTRDFTIQEVLHRRPAHLRAHRNQANSDIGFEWVRRSRSSDNWDALEVDADFDVEAYRLDILDGSNVLRQETLSLPQFTYTAAMQSADWGGLASAFDVRIRQISSVWGPGDSANYAISV